MSVYILIKAEDGWNSSDEMCWKTGYLIDARDKSRIGGKQVPPKFIQVEITDEDDPAAVQGIYCGEWKKEIDWEFVGHNYAIDGHRLKVFIKPELISASGLNRLTRVQVEAFLNKWNASVVSTSQGEVTFDARIYNCLTSQGFWGRDTSLIDFDEKDYDQATGLHTVEADYRNDPVLSGMAQEKIENKIEQNGGSISSHPTGKVTFTISRISIFSVFKNSVKEAIDGSFSRRKFKLLQEHVQLALDAVNSTFSVTKQQFAQYIYSRLND